MPRNIERCANRRMRSSGGPIGQRRLCLCSPGGPGTCNLCAQRGTLTDPLDSCAGFNQPVVQIGSRFRVTRMWTLSAVYDEVFPSGITRQGSATAQYGDEFVVAARSDLPPVGQCRWILESWAGSGSMNANLSQSGSAGFSNVASFSGSEWQWHRLAGPVLTPVVLPGFLLQTFLGPTPSLMFVYPRPAAIQAQAANPNGSDFFYTTMNNAAGNWSVLGFSTLAYIAPPNSPLTMPARSGWQGLACSGSFQTVQSGFTYAETWNNAQQPMYGRAAWTASRSRQSTITSTIASASTWRLELQVTPITPCPGSRPDANTQAIADFMAKAHPCAGCG